MGLFDSPFQSIKSGRKTVEVRLNDEKRRKMNIGDRIKFVKVPEENDDLFVEVLELRVFPTFKEMYESIPADNFDTVGDTMEKMLSETYEVYTPEQEKQWGTLAITIKLIKD